MNSKLVLNYFVAHCAAKNMVKAWLEDQMLDISAAPNIWAFHHHEKKDPDATDNHDEDDAATNEHC